MILHRDFLTHRRQHKHAYFVSRASAVSLITEHCCTAAVNGNGTLIEPRKGKVFPIRAQNILNRMTFSTQTQPTHRMGCTYKLVGENAHIFFM